MANTYSKIYLQIVFAVKGRQSLIHSSWEERLYRYLTGVVQTKGQKMLSINGVANHIHLLIGVKPDCCVSDLVREIKKSSTQFINENRFAQSQFAWQVGFGVFSYHESMLDKVIRYIENQKEHHKKHTFKEEYIAFLKAFNIDYEEKYLFDWLED
ncbi:IS200/IS605 family transposase [Runella sp.]|uniref:IS200/IS605 family transposase n=1 Tax=Runella sp. TaxID=1960881 RepID=UPI003D0A54D4